MVDAKEKGENRSFPNLERNVNEWSLSVKAGEGDNKVTVLSLDEKESVELDLGVRRAASAAQTATKGETTTRVRLGPRARLLRSRNDLLKERDDFRSQTCSSISRSTRTISVKNPLFKNINTFFNARLTSIAVAADEAAETGDGNGGMATARRRRNPAPRRTAKEFITSRKAAMMQAGIYFPMYWDFTTWKRTCSTCR